MSESTGMNRETEENEYNSADEELDIFDRTCAEYDSLSSDFSSDEPNSDEYYSSDSDRSTPEPSFDTSEWHDIEISDTDFELFQEDCLINDEVRELSIRKPMDIFKYFVNNEIVNVIVTETNICARKETDDAWVDTTAQEIRKFLGITLAMGIVQLPYIKLYWTEDDPLLIIKFISTVTAAMPEERYRLLRKYLSFENEDTADKSNNLYKIQRVLSLLLNNFQKVLKPGRDLVIDEITIPYGGWVSRKTKSHKCGIKLYKLCSPNEYTFDIQIYSIRDDIRNVKHAKDIITNLLEKVDPKEGRVVYAHEFFSSVEQAEKLYEEKILYCGMLRKARKGVPSGLFSEKLGKDQTFGRQKNKVKIVKWVDRYGLPRLMISTNPTHGTNLLPTGKQNKKGKDILEPQCFTDFDKARKQVDSRDDRFSRHPVQKNKVIPYHRKVMIELLLNTAVMNAWIIFNHLAPKKLRLTDFEIELVKNLTMTYTSERKITKKRSYTFMKAKAGKRGCLGKVQRHPKK